MKIAIACDHGGYLLKQDLLIWMEENDIEYEDFGCFSTESVDYPVFVSAQLTEPIHSSCYDFFDFGKHDSLSLFNFASLFNLHNLSHGSVNSCVNVRVDLICDILFLL